MRMSTEIAWKKTYGEDRHQPSHYVFRVETIYIPAIDLDRFVVSGFSLHVSGLKVSSSPSQNRAVYH